MLRETSLDVLALVNEMQWYDLRTLVAVRLALVGLCSSVGLRLKVAVTPPIAPPSREIYASKQSSMLCGLNTLSNLTTLRLGRGASEGQAAAGLFARLSGVRTLDMAECRQSTITDQTFMNLSNLHTLNMSRRTQSTITDRAFAHLTELHTLNLSQCNQRSRIGRL